MREQKKHSHLRKRVQMQKCINLFSTNKYVLFFHYNGRSACNWQQIKDHLWEEGVFKSLLVQSKCTPLSQFFGGLPLEKPTPLSPRGDQGGAAVNKSVAWVHGEFTPGGGFPRQEWHHSRVQHPFQGPTLLVACSSLEQFDVVVKKCPPPHFVCIGGVHKKTLLTHLDIQRCMQLQGNAEQVYPALLESLKQWHHLLYLLKNQMNWHFLRFHQNKMVALLRECHHGAGKPPAGDLSRGMLNSPERG